jgi:hypothetical protein
MTDIRDQIDLSVFSLVCENCDAGDDMLNEVDARATGWTQIEYAADLPMANFVGLCPDCATERQRTERRHRRA